MEEPTDYPILVTSAGRVGYVNLDGSGEDYPDFGVSDQVNWGAGPLFGDMHRIILTSFEDMTISKLVVGEVRTHTWMYDFWDARIDEILLEDRASQYMDCSGIMPGEDRLLAAAIVEGERRLFICNIDGSDKRALSEPGWGFIYGEGLSPDGERISFHITGGKRANARELSTFRPGPYAINVMNTDGANRVLVAGKPGHLYFAPVWSPDGEWLAYVDCHSNEDPAHFGADICIGRPDGSEHRELTEGQSNWFGTSYGSKDNRGGGSNGTCWSPDGTRLLYTRLKPDSHADCEYHPELGDHQELVYRPELARGGTQICALDIRSGGVTELTEEEEGKWEHHPYYLVDGGKIVYGKAYVGRDNELWIMDADGRNQRLLTRGYEDKGANAYRPHRLRLTP